MFCFRLLGLIFFSGCLSFGSPLNLEELKINFINDFVKFENRPVSIIAHLCWKRQYLRQLLKDVSKNIFVTGIAILDLDKHKLNHHNPPHQILYVTDLDCNKSDEILLKANEPPSLFAAPYRWLIFNSENFDLKMFDALHIFPSSELVLATRVNETNFNLFQPYKISSNKPTVIMEKYGVWTPESEITDYRNTSILSRRRSNLQKSILRVTYAYLEDDTINHFNEYKDLNNDTVSKVSYILTNYVLESLNATIQKQFTRSWGYPKKNGVGYTGMIGELLDNETDVGGTATYFYKYRGEVVKFVAPLVLSSAAIIFRQPPLSYVNNLFALPFGINIWICTILLVVFVDLFLYIAIAWEWKSEKLSKANGPEGRLEASGSDLILMSVGALCQQGSPGEPKTASGRTAFILFFIFLMFIFTAYSANIVALLQSPSSMIKTKQDLMDSPLTVAAVDNVYIRYAIENSTDPIKIALRRKKKPEYLPIAEGIAKIREAQYAFIAEPGIAYRIIQQMFLEYEKCSLYEISYSDYPDTWAITQLNSSYLEILKIAYRKMAEGGIKIRENQIFYERKPKCDGSASFFTSVGLIDIYFAFYIILIGFFISLVIFFVEILLKCQVWKKWKSNQRKRFLR